jgi:DNA polymerase gamma 1
VALCGHFHLIGSVVPLLPDWEDWIKNVERVFKEHNDEMTQICKDLVWKTYEGWKETDDKETYEQSDPWLSQLDWKVQSLKGKYANVPNWIRPFVKDPEAAIGVKSRLAHLMLKLEWEGQPLTWIEGEGWCYWSEE